MFEQAGAGGRCWWSAWSWCATSWTRRSAWCRSASPSTGSTPARRALLCMVALVQKQRLRSHIGDVDICLGLHGLRHQLLAQDGMGSVAHRCKTCLSSIAMQRIVVTSWTLDAAWKRACSVHISCSKLPCPAPHQLALLTRRRWTWRAGPQRSRVQTARCMSCATTCWWARTASTAASGAQRCCMACCVPLAPACDSGPPASADAPV